MLSILLSILVCAAASLFCACLVSVHVSAPYVIAGSTQELYTCLFRQMASLLLKMSRCLAYAAQPANYIDIINATSKCVCVFRNVVDTKTFPSARSDPTFGVFAVHVRLCKRHECGSLHVFTMTVQATMRSSLQFSPS